MSLPPKFKPMLADPVNLKLLRYPVIGSPKLDGVRAISDGEKLLSRSLKLIPNPSVQKMFGRLKFLDGELIVGSPTDPNAIQATTSGVMSKTGEPDVKFYVFDHVERPGDCFDSRRILLAKTLDWYDCPQAVLVEQVRLESEKQLLAFEERQLALGYEGIMLRSPLGTYKFGRSTANEQHLLKLKRFEDSEARIIDFVEEQHNTNEATTNELGRTKRSSAKSGLVGKGSLGAFVVEGCKDFPGVRFQIGGGFTAEQREAFWANRAKLKGKIVKFKYFSVGVLHAPRHPVFLALRDVRDM